MYRPRSTCMDRRLTRVETFFAISKFSASQWTILFPDLVSSLNKTIPIYTVTCSVECITKRY